MVDLISRGMSRSPFPIANRPHARLVLNSKEDVGSIEYSWAPPHDPRESGLSPRKKALAPTVGRGVSHEAEQSSTRSRVLWPPVEFEIRA